MAAFRAGPKAAVVVGTTTPDRLPRRHPLPKRQPHPTALRKARDTGIGAGAMLLLAALNAPAVAGFAQHSVVFAVDARGIPSHTAWVRVD